MFSCLDPHLTQDKIQFLRDGFEISRQQLHKRAQDHAFLHSIYFTQRDKSESMSRASARDVWTVNWVFLEAKTRTRSKTSRGEREERPAGVRASAGVSTSSPWPAPTAERPLWPPGRRHSGRRSRAWPEEAGGTRPSPELWLWRWALPAFDGLRSRSTRGRPQPCPAQGLRRAPAWARPWAASLSEEPRVLGSVLSEFGVGFRR